MNRYLRDRRSRRMMDRDMRRGSMRMRDRTMRREYEDYPEYDGNYEYDRPMKVYGYGEIRRGDSRSRGYDYSNGDDYEYKEDLKYWIEKMKSKDKYGMTKEQAVQHAKNIGANFEDYSQDEFYAIYLAMATDYGDITNDPTIFIRMALDFLKDDDVEMRGSDKVCAYLYSIVLGEDD